MVVARKSFVWREIEKRQGMGIVSNIWRHLAFANPIDASSVLNFDFGVVGFYDGGFKDFCLESIVEWLQKFRRLQCPPASSRAWNNYFTALRNFCLSVMWQAVGKFADDCVGQENWSAKCSGPRCCRFFCRDHIRFAFRTCAYFLLMFKFFDGRFKMLKLIADFVADKDGRCRAGRTARFIRSHFMWHLSNWRPVLL